VGFFIIAGVISLVLVAIIAVFIGYASYIGSTLDKESKAYVDRSVPAIVSSWSEEELINRASPEFKQAIEQAEMNRLFRWFRTLGPLETYEGSQGQATISVTPQTGKVVSARYLTKGRFERGEATIQINVIKHGDAWQIAGFKVDSSALSRDAL
jgi:hypothetical protein